MNGLSNFAQVQFQILANSANSFLSNLAEFLPALLGALLILILGLIVAKICHSVTKNITKWVGLNKAAEKTGVDKTLEKAGLSEKVIDVVAALVYWIVLLIFISAALETLGLTVIVQTVNALIAYLPQVIIAVVIMIFALWLGRFVKMLLDEMIAEYSIAYSSVITTFAEALIVVAGFSIALAQLGLDLGFITTNITAIVIGIVAALALSVGLGSRALSANLLSGYYVKKQHKIGDTVMLGGFEGKIKEITSTAVVMESDGKTIIVPNSEVIGRGSSK